MQELFNKMQALCHAYSTLNNTQHPSDRIKKDMELISTRIESLTFLIASASEPSSPPPQHKIDDDTIPF